MSWSVKPDSWNGPDPDFYAGMESITAYPEIANVALETAMVNSNQIIHGLLACGR